jgi:Ca2+:H+ antiporter
MSKVAYGGTVLLTLAVIVVELLHASTLLIFALTSLALIELAWVLGQATESLGHHAGPRVGGVLNATFGNVAEHIVGVQIAYKTRCS